MEILLNDRLTVMGILNCTPDSFYTGSRKQTESEIAKRSDEIIGDGGEIIDIGAFSTRPGAKEVSEAEELSRMRFALGIVRREHPDAVISIDTYRTAVARMAVEEYGANIINDVSEGGLAFVGSADDNGSGALTAGSVTYGDMFREVGRLGVAYILMSVQRDMQSMIECFQREVAMLREAGVRDIILDPGYGFGKDVMDGNYAILREQKRLRECFPDMPLLAGMSRKRMVWQLLDGDADSKEALHGTMLVNLVALQNGASILRVHDVKEAIETIKIFERCHTL